MVCSFEDGQLGREANQRISEPHSNPVQISRWVQRSWRISSRRSEREGLHPPRRPYACSRRANVAVTHLIWPHCSGQCRRRRSRRRTAPLMRPRRTCTRRSAWWWRRLCGRSGSNTPGPARLAVAL